MYDEDFSKYNSELKELYKNDPATVTDELRRLVNKLSYPEEKHDDKLFNNSIDKEKFMLCTIFILMALLGLLNFGNAESFGMYYFGFVFFLAGYFASSTVKGAGIIFLFSHGITGIVLMIVFTLKNAIKSPIMQDSPKNMLIYLGTAIALIVIATITAILRNLSEKFKYKKYSSLIPITLYFIAMLMIVLFPRIMNYLYAL